MFNGRNGIGCGIDFICPTLGTAPTRVVKLDKVSKRLYLIIDGSKVWAPAETKAVKNGDVTFRRVIGLTYAVNVAGAEETWTVKVDGDS